MGFMGPIGLMGLMGVMDFSPVRFVRCVRCFPPFWTPFNLILDTPPAFCFHPLSRLSRFPLLRYAKIALLAIDPELNSVSAQTNASMRSGLDCVISGL